MTANDSTPATGESASTEQTADWESLGRAVFVEALEVRGDRLREAWMAMAQKAKNGEPVTRRDWVRLSDELQQFAILVEEIGKATSGRDGRE
jgi:hypothetical protein